MRTVTLKYIIRVFLLILFLYFRDYIETNKTQLSDLYFFLKSISDFLIFFTIINIATAILIMIYRLRKNIPYKYTDNVINGINNLYYLSITFGILMMVLGFWGINFKVLITSLSIVAAAIAIIAKDYVSEIISGIIISFSKEINIDDYVKIGENKGKILEINLTKVALQNDDDDIIYIPNDKVYLSEIINYTKKDIRKISIDFEMNLSYHSNIEEFEKQLTDSLKTFQQYIEPDSFNIKIVDVFHEYLTLKFQYVLKESNREIERMIRKKTIRLIADMMKSKPIK